MITVKLIPNIFKEDGRQQIDLAYNRDKTVREYLIESCFDFADQKIIVSGKRCNNLDSLIENGDEIIITPEISDPVTMGIIGSALLIGGSIAAGTLATVLTVAGLVVAAFGSIKAYMDLQRQPSYNTDAGGGFDERSPTYGWDGIQTIQEVGVPLPIIYGEHKVGGNIVNMFITTKKQADIVYSEVIEQVIPGNVIIGDYVNQFRISQPIYGIKFNVNALEYQSGRSSLSTEMYVNLYSYVQYKIYYKLTTDSAWTLGAIVGGGRSRSYYVDYSGSQVVWIDQRTNFPINIELPVNTYDVKIVDESQRGTRNKQYYDVINAKISTVSITNTDDQVLNMLLALGEGEIDSVKDIKINENPIGNFKDIEQYIRAGTNGQSVIPNFNDLANLYALNVKLSSGVAYAYTTEDSDVEGFEIIFDMPQGIYSQNQSTGKIEPWEIDYKIEYKLHSSGTWIDLGTYPIKYGSRTDAKKIFRKDGIAAGQYDVRITKTSADSDFYHIGELYVQNINELKTDDLAYPNTALLGLKVIATEQLSGGIPNVTAVVRGIKVRVPQIMYAGAEVAWEDYYWDPATSQYKRFSDSAVCTWDGVTYVSRWCANPIWCLRDFLTNTRYGLGDFIESASINDTDFLAMARHCDERVDNGYGSYEKRYRMDIVIDGASRALDLITQLTNTFNGYAFYSEGTIKLKIDKADTPVQLFGMGNIVKGSFSQSWKSVKEVPNVVEVQFLNADQDYKQDTIAVFDEDAIAAGEPLRKKSIRLFVTRPSYAIRGGRYAMKYAKYVNRGISFKVGIDAIACQAGDLVSVSHDVPQWGFSGRVQAGSTTTKVKLDRSVTLSVGVTYKVRVRLSNDTIEECTVMDGAGSYTEVNVTPAFSVAPAAYDVYAFGQFPVKDFRIVSISRESGNEIEIGAIEYDSRVYDDTAVTLPMVSCSALKGELSGVTNLSLYERIVKLPDGTIEDAIDVYFNRPAQSDYYVRRYDRARIYVSENAGASWILKGETSGEFFTIIGGIRDNGSYVVAVVSVDPENREQDRNKATQATINIIGKQAKPANVASFQVIKDGDDIVFNWSPNADIDLYGYEIREGDSWDRGTVVVSEILTNYYRMPVFGFGERRFMIKAIDTTGNYSATEAVQVITIASTITIENLQDNNLDVWAEGNQEASSQNTELVVDNSGASVTNSSGTPIEQTGLYGFVQSIQTDDQQLIRSDGEMLIDSENNVLMTTVSETAFLQFDYFGDHYATQGVYVSKVIDLGAKISARLSVNINIEGLAAVYDLYIKTSDDGITWSDWILFSAGEYACRYFRIKAVVTNSDTSLVARLWNLKSRATVRVTEDRGQDVAVNQTLDIVFSKKFYVKVNVMVIAQGTKYARVTAKSLNGFTVAVRDDGTGALATGNVDWVAEGY